MLERDIREPADPLEEDIKDALSMWGVVAAWRLYCYSEKDLKGWAKEWDAWKDQIRVLVRFRNLIKDECSPGAWGEYLKFTQ